MPPTEANPHIRPPEPLKLGNDRATNWKLWRQLWENYCIVTDLDNESRSEAYKKAFLISVMGIEALQIYNGCDPSDTDTHKEIVKKLEKHILGETNETFERYKFNTRKQQPEENIDSYVAALKTLAKSCNFCDCIKDSLLRDKIVLGVVEEATRKRLLQERKLSLSICIDICRSYEDTSSQLKVISGAHSRSDEIHAVKNKSKDKYYGSKPRKRFEKHEQGEKNCKFCGYTHILKKEKCPAWGKRCAKCGKENHFAKCCMDSRQMSKVHQVYDEHNQSDSDDEDIAYIQTIQEKDKVNMVSEALYSIMTLPGGEEVKFQIDSGASVNVLPARYTQGELSPSTKTLMMYNSSELKPKGTCRMIIKNPADKKKYNVEFQIVEDDLTPLLSCKAAQAMGLIMVNYDNIVNKVSTVANTATEYSKVFDNGLGKFPGEVHVKVKHDVATSQAPARRVPIALNDKLKQELDDMVRKGILLPVTEPTEWCSQISLQTKKDGSMRICIDPRSLNEALQREIYMLPTLDDVLPQLANAKVFSKIDLKNGYWHCVLDEESSYLTTIATPFGRYRWLRLPFGLKVSSEIFQRKLNEALEGLEGFACIADDGLVFGTNQEDHDQNLVRVLKRCDENGIKLNLPKCVVSVSTVDFSGHVFSDQGIKPDLMKIEAIVKMHDPEDVEGVRRLLGTVNYLAKFLPRISDIVEPLRRLTHKDAPWEWGEEQARAIKEVKRLLTTAPVLGYYDKEKELAIECDASSTGLGAALMQDKPLFFASRALSQTERGYAHIEKECLAIVYALEKFHNYTYGRNIIVYSDHKPLESILKKPLSKAPKRLQRMMLRLLQYDIEVRYKKGPEMYISDMLSRAHLETKDGDQDFEHVCMVTGLKISDDRLRELRESTARDKTMVLLKSAILDGWMESKDKLAPPMAPYHSYREEMSVSDGLIFKGDRVVIPEGMRKDITRRLHTSHLGTESMLRRARECVFWPQMSGDLKQLTSQCEACQTYASAQPREPLMQVESDYPWEIIGTDIFSLEGKEYLVTVDYFSSYWEVDKLSSPTSKQVIHKLKAHFSRFGIPARVISDNGTQYTSEEFRNFAQEWDFEHCTSSPHHPSGNGKAESAVKAAKRLITKCGHSGDDTYLALLELRNTPPQGNSSSPVQRLLNRRTRTTIPTLSRRLLQREPGSMDADRKELKTHQWNVGKHHDRGKYALPTLCSGDVVRMRPFKLGRKQWEKAVVSRQLDSRSYTVETPTGVYRRNRVDLRPTSETPPEETVFPSPEKITLRRDMIRSDTPASTEKSLSAPQDKPIDVPMSAPGTSPRRSSRTSRPPRYLEEFVRK